MIVDNLTENMQDLYTDNYKMLLTEIKEDLRNKHIVLPDWRTRYYEDSRYPQTNLQLQGNPIKVSPAFWVEIDKFKGNPPTLLVGMQTSTATMENSVEIP